MTNKLQAAGTGSLSILSEVLQEISARGRHLCPMFSGFCFNLFGGFTSLASINPSCVGQGMQEHCSSGVFTAAV